MMLIMVILIIIVHAHHIEDNFFLLSINESSSCHASVVNLLQYDQNDIGVDYGDHLSKVVFSISIFTGIVFVGVFSLADAIFISLCFAPFH